MAAAVRAAMASGERDRMAHAVETTTLPHFGAETAEAHLVDDSYGRDDRTTHSFDVAPAIGVDCDFARVVLRGNGPPFRIYDVAGYTAPP